MINTYVVGDVHGCYDSLIELLELVNFNVDRDMLISVGDLVDKGPKTKEVLDFFMKYGYPVVRGNHEDKIARLAKGNKIKINSEIQDTVEQLGEGWQETYGLFLQSMPLYLPFEDALGKGYIVHGGVAPDLPIERQSSNFLMRLRTWPFEEYVRGVEATQPPWQTEYRGHLGTILHGHIPSAGVMYAGSEKHGNPNVYSLDGGCVYGNDRPWGGSLRAIKLDTREIFSVPGNQEQTEHYNSL